MAVNGDESLTLLRLEKSGCWIVDLIDEIIDDLFDFFSVDEATLLLFLVASLAVDSATISLLLLLLLLSADDEDVDDDNESVDGKL